jgi:hypothetical protein
MGAAMRPMGLVKSMGIERDGRLVISWWIYPVLHGKMTGMIKPVREVQGAVIETGSSISRKGLPALRVFLSH